MKRNLPRLFAFGILLLCNLLLSAQEKADSLTDEVKNSILKRFDHFKIGFYVDAYLNMEFDDNRDTTDIVPFYANCPMTDQIRLNVAAIEMFYDAERVRGKIQLQFGDAPNLLASPEKQWIKNIRQATVGFRIGKKLWTDLGFMFTPVGSESAWPVINYISTASVCAYFEPGAVMGIKFTYQFSDKVSAGFMVGNPYSIAYQQSNRLGGVMFVSYSPPKNLNLAYSNLFGNQTLRGGNIKNNLLYNDVLVTYDPLKYLTLIGQFDFAFQSNSKMAPDTNKTASMCSGFLLAKIKFLSCLSLTGRYEYYYDPQGFLSGLYTYNGTTSGLKMNGLGLSFECKPVSFSYIRFEYKYMKASQGNLVYYGDTSDKLNAFIMTAGVKF